METARLIEGLSRDARLSALPLRATLVRILVAAVVLAALVFAMMLGPRPDLDLAMRTWRFVFKFVVTLALVATAWAALSAVARPTGADRSRMAWLLAPVVLLAGSVAIEMAAMPSGTWETRWMGTNAMLCLASIPAIGILPLAVLLAGLTRSAPANPALAGAMAGLVAGGVAATLYAAHCFDDSPLFVATWYPLAVLILAAVGALAGWRILRW